MTDHELADAAYENRANADLILIGRCLAAGFAVAAGAVVFVFTYIAMHWPG